MTTDKKQEVFPYTCYQHNGITYVPHYKNPMAFVRPGYPVHNQDTYTADQLLEAGAEPVTEHLFARPAYATPNWDMIIHLH